MNMMVLVIPGSKGGETQLHTQSPNFSARSSGTTIGDLQARSFTNRDSAASMHLSHGQNSLYTA